MFLNEHFVRKINANPKKNYKQYFVRKINGKNYLSPDKIQHFGEHVRSDNEVRVDNVWLCSRCVPPKLQCLVVIQARVAKVTTSDYAPGACRQSYSVWWWYMRVLPKLQRLTMLPVRAAKVTPSGCDTGACCQSYNVILCSRCVPLKSQRDTERVSKL